MSARSMLFMRPRPGCRAAVVELFERLDVVGQALRQNGCLSVELQAGREEGSPLLVTALWRDRGAYDGWLSNPWREQASAQLDPLLIEEPSGDVYDVLIAGHPLAAADSPLAAEKTP